jgi:hypothetical protein
MKMVAEVGLALLLGAVLPNAHAVESMVLYDAFGTGSVDNAKWLESELLRSTDGTGTMRHSVRYWGTTSADTGSDSYSNGSSVTDPSRITQLRASVKVTSIEATACPANATASVARARLLGSFFNTGNPRTGSYYGDVIAQVYLYRASNSGDAPGVLRVQGSAVVCTDTDCNSSTSLGTVDLGTATVGSWVSLQVEFDKANKRFVFGRDSGAITAPVAYSVSDSVAPSRNFKSIGTRHTVARCASGPKPTAAIDAYFTKVRVNKSAL